MSGYYQQEDERVHHVLSQETIDRALADDAARRQGGGYSTSSQSQSQSHSQGPAHPGITRKDTTTRRDPITGDMIEEYSGKDENGPAMRAHYNWDEPEKGPNTTGGQYSSGGTYGSSGSSAPPPVRRTNTTISYDSSGNKVEEHEGDGPLEIRALHNHDEDSSNVYNPNYNPNSRPHGPPRHQSEQGSRRY